MQAVSTHLLERVQEVYREQGVEGNDKHIAVIIKQMLAKVEVVDPEIQGLLLNKK